LTVDKVSNIAKLHTYYMTNAQNELNYIANSVSELEFEQIMENYSNSIEYDDDMFINEELDMDYISDEDDLDKLRQYDCENLEVKEMIDFNIFLKEQTQTNEAHHNIDVEDETDYNIDEVVSAAMSNRK
ncbi:35336_t:CDS:1, partial [Racocetra persica]